MHTHSCDTHALKLYRACVHRATCHRLIWRLYLIPVALCVNFPWAGANRLNVTAPGKHKQATSCVQKCHCEDAAWQRLVRAGRCGGVMKKHVVQEADSCHLRVRRAWKSKRSEAEEYLAWPCIFMLRCGAAGASHPLSSGCEDTSGPLCIY